MENKPHLLFVMYDKPSHPSGPIVNFRRILPKLVEKGYQVSLISFYMGGDYVNARYLEEFGVAIYPFPYTVPLKEKVRTILKVTEKIQPDVFIPDVSTAGCFAAKWMKPFGIPSVNSHRSDDENNWSKAVYFSDDKNGFTTSGIFCVSHFLLNELKNRVNELNVVTKVIPSGVILPEYISDQSADVLKIVYAGRMVQEQKRIRETLALAVELCKVNDQLEFTFIGDGPMLDECKETVREHKLDGKISFTGVLMGEEYKQKIAEHHVVLLLSDYEGIPGAVMDGMSCGLIPIVNNYEGAADLVSDGQDGFLVERKINEIQEILDRLLSDKALRLKLGATARIKISEQFSIDFAVSKWEELIAELTSKYEKTNFIAPSSIVLPKNTSLGEFTLDKQYSVMFKLRSRLRLRDRYRNLMIRSKR